jgi:hypothetical protein
MKESLLKNALRILQVLWGALVNLHHRTSLRRAPDKVFK